MDKRYLFSAILACSGLLFCSKEQKLPLPDLATRRLFKLKDTLMNSDFFEKKLKAGELVGEVDNQELTKLFSPANQADKKVSSALKTISDRYSFFAAGDQEKKKKYLEALSIDLLLELVEAMSQLGIKNLKNLKKDKKQLEARLESLIKKDPKAVDYVSYEQIVKALEYLEKDRSVTWSYSRQFQKDYAAYRKKQEIVEYIAPFLSGYLEVYKAFHKFKTIDKVIIDILTGVGKPRSALLSLHEHLAFFRDDPEIYLKSLSLEELLRLATDLDYFPADKLDTKAVALQDALVRELAKGGVTAKNYTPILRALNYLEQQAKPILPMGTDKPFCTFVGESGGASFGTSANEIMFLYGKEPYTIQPGTKTEIVTTPPPFMEEVPLVSPDKKFVVRRSWFQGPQQPQLRISQKGCKEAEEDAFKAWLTTYTFSADSKTIYLGFGANDPYANAGPGYPGGIQEMDMYGERAIKRTFIDPETEGLKSAHLSDISIIVASPDGKYFVSAAEDEYVVKIWDVASGKVRTKIDTKAEPLSIAISADGTSIAIGTKAGQILLSDNEGKVFGVCSGDKSPVYWLNWAPDKTLLLVGTHAQDSVNSLGEVSLYSVVDKKLMMVFKHIFPDAAVERNVYHRKRTGACVLFSPNGRYLLASDPSKTTVWRVPPEIWFEARFAKFAPKKVKL